jgi:Rrf2 family protein
MPKISADWDRGVLALFDIAYNYGGGRTQAKEIAARQRLSQGHIEQVFQRLKRANLVRSLRDPAGGYSLARPVGEITIGDIIRAADRPIQLVSCVGDGPQSREYCERIHSCITREVWKAASNLLMSIFDSVTLADLCEAAMARGVERALEAQLIYHI